MDWQYELQSCGNLSICKKIPASDLVRLLGLPKPTKNTSRELPKHFQQFFTAAQVLIDTISNGKTPRDVDDYLSDSQFMVRPVDELMKSFGTAIWAQNLTHHDIISQGEDVIHNDDYMRIHKYLRLWLAKRVWMKAHNSTKRKPDPPPTFKSTKLSDHTSSISSEHLHPFEVEAEAAEHERWTHTSTDEHALPSPEGTSRAESEGDESENDSVISHISRTGRFSTRYGSKNRHARTDYEAQPEASDYNMGYASRRPSKIVKLHLDPVLLSVFRSAIPRSGDNQLNRSEISERNNSIAQSTANSDAESFEKRYNGSTSTSRPPSVEATRGGSEYTSVSPNQSIHDASDALIEPTSQSVEAPRRHIFRQLLELLQSSLPVNPIYGDLVDNVDQVLNTSEPTQMKQAIADFGQIKMAYDNWKGIHEQLKEFRRITAYDGKSGEDWITYRRSLGGWTERRICAMKAHVALIDWVHEKRRNDTWKDEVILNKNLAILFSYLVDLPSYTWEDFVDGFRAYNRELLGWFIL